TPIFAGAQFERARSRDDAWQSWVMRVTALWERRWIRGPRASARARSVGVSKPYLVRSIVGKAIGPPPSRSPAWAGGRWSGAAGNTRLGPGRQIRQPQRPWGRAAQPR